MDGVLVDFVKGFGKISDDPKVKHPQKYQNKYGDDVFWKLIQSHGMDLWKDLDWTPDGKQLWKYIRYKQPIICSTPNMGYMPSYEGKKKWVAQHLGSYKVILTDKKYQWADSNSILIDDYYSNIGPWESAGGIGILHKSASNTISKLKKLGI
jgi:hypothetical protein